MRKKIMTTTLGANERFVIIGRWFFAVGLFGIGVQHFIFSHFIIVMVPWWPSWIPFQTIGPYILGTYLAAASVLMVFGKRPRLVATITGLLFLILFVIIQIPFNAVSNLLIIGAWTNAIKEFAFWGCDLVVVGSLPEEKHNIKGKASFIGHLENNMLPFAKYPLSLLIIIFGLDHFIYTNFVASLVPYWIPGHIYWTYVTGTALIAAGIGIILNIKAKLAAALLGIMLFLWVIILHLPRAIADSTGLMGNEWTSVFEALSFSGSAFILSCTLSKNVKIKGE